MLARAIAPAGLAKIFGCGAPVNGSAGSCDPPPATVLAAPLFAALEALGAPVCAPANATHNKLVTPKISIRFIVFTFRYKFLSSASAF